MWRTVKDVMTVDVATASEGTPSGELVRLLAERRISTLPVVDDDQRVRGHLRGRSAGQAGSSR